MLYAARAESKLYPGWSAAVGVPKDEIDSAVHRSVYALSAAGVSTITIACLLCFVLVRAYARRATTLALEDSLREKETLLREVHHRVKNNMQGTMGVLLFERSRLRDDHAKERLQVISDRISIQGRVHQHLYEQGDLHRIEFGAFLTELCQSIMATFCQDSYRDQAERRCRHAPLRYRRGDAARADHQRTDDQCGQARLQGPSAR